MTSPYDDGPHGGRPRGGSQPGPGGYPPQAQGGGARPAGPPPGARQPGPGAGGPQRGPNGGPGGMPP
ncbi:hypothetical protein GL303_02165, partial [Nocardia seriolae]|nr:hypothetical protein [Nocardia seriolae]